MKLTREQRQIGYAASKDDSQPVLQNVLIEKGRAIATNGAMMAEVALDDDSWDVDEGSMLIPAESLLRAKDRKLLEGVLVGLPQEDGTVQVVGERTEVVVLGQGTFPELAGLYPTGQPKHVIAFDISQLAALEKVCGKGTRVIFTFYEHAASPVKFEVKDKQIRGLIMPMRRDSPDTGGR